ncbi:MAG TPA: ABC transporter ATP-binding protein [Ramlibacter sp.]|nr:ABC transporter ATP-binding protein [Ramlibacter sp.]
MVDIRDLWLTYPGATQASVQGISLAVEKGEFLTLLGPSGCGKTSTLRSIAGLETPSAGSIAIAAQPVFDAGKRIAVPVHARDIAMVFQSYAIWPHMSVRQNVAFPLDVMKLSREETRQRVDEALDMVGLRDFADRSATRLSGGQQQRVAIARALVRRAAVMLLDEPLSNLDAKLREQMRIELRDLLKRVGMTAVYVTHDQEEALMLSDRIALMNGGRIVEIGTPRGLYLSPSTEFGASFLGAAEVIPVIATRGRVVQTPLGELELEREHQDLASVTIRPESIAVRSVAEALPASPNRRPARVLGVVFSGRQQQLRIELEAGHRLTALVDPHRAYAAGDALQIEFPPARLMPLRKEP